MIAWSICWRLAGNEIRGWPSPAEAFEAATVVPCGDGCVGKHGVVYRDRHGRFRVAGPPPPVLPLAAQLARCYPRPPRLHDIAHREEPSVTPDELRRRQDEAIAATADRQLEPTPGGAAGRVAAAHHAAAGLRARPDAARYADQIRGHEMAVKAMTDAAPCERENDQG